MSHTSQPQNTSQPRLNGNLPGPKKAKDLRLNIRLSQQEWDKIHKLAANSTCRNVSEYARKVLTEKPVNVFYRNQSFDIFEEHITRLLPQLELFGDNYDKITQQILALNALPSMVNFLSAQMTYGKGFLGTVAEIKSLIEKLSDQCDPK